VRSSWIATETTYVRVCSFLSHVCFHLSRIHSKGQSTFSTFSSSNVYSNLQNLFISCSHCGEHNNLYIKSKSACCATSLRNASLRVYYLLAVDSRRAHIALRSMWYNNNWDHPAHNNSCVINIHTLVQRPCGPISRCYCNYIIAYI
jgi:hypothetical protein